LACGRLFCPRPRLRQAPFRVFPVFRGSPSSTLQPFNACSSQPSTRPLRPSPALSGPLIFRTPPSAPGPAFRAWLNALPVVQALLARDFGGSPISKQNLSEWRAGGFAEWQVRQDTLAPARGLAAEATQLAAAADGRLTDHLATVLAARYAAALVGWNGEMTEPFSRKLRTLRGLFQAIVALRRGDLTGARLNLAQERRARERAKTGPQMGAPFQRGANDPLTPESPVEAGLAVDGSNPVKPGQTENNIVFFGLSPLSALARRTGPRFAATFLANASTFQPFNARSSQASTSPLKPSQALSIFRGRPFF